MTENRTTYGASGYQTSHVDQFLCVPGARVVVDGTENEIRIEELLAIVGRIAATQPRAKVRYWVEIDS